MKLDDLDTAADGAQVLDEAHKILTRYVVFPCPEAADAAALYAAATHAMPGLEFASRLVIKSPVKRCGKSRLLDVLAQLVHKPMATADISAAALVRSIPEDEPPTIMLDEADAIFGKALKGDEKAEHLRGILNAGFGRDRPYKRWDITTRSVEDCPTFAMAVLAGIGNMPDTIEDRAVILTLRRKSPAERAAKYRLRKDKPKVTAVGDRLAAWVTPNRDAIGEAEPAMPPGLNDRAEDVWEALIAIADLAGGSLAQAVPAAPPSCSRPPPRPTPPSPSASACSPTSATCPAPTRSRSRHPAIWSTASSSSTTHHGATSSSPLADWPTGCARTASRRAATPAAPCGATGSRTSPTHSAATSRSKGVRQKPSTRQKRALTCADRLTLPGHLTLQTVRRNQTVRR